LKLASGAVIAQAIGILVSPIITRIYDPQAFGLSAIFVSLSSIITTVACLRYHLAIMLPESDDDAANLLALCLFFPFIMSGITAIILWFGKAEILSLLNANGIEPYLWMMPFSVFFGGVFLALNFWNSRTRKYGRLSKARVIASITSSGTQISIGLAGYRTFGSLIAAGMLGSVVSTLILGAQIWRDDFKVLMSSIHIHQMPSALMRYKKFPIYDSWTAILNTISWQLPVLMLSTFFSAKEVGFYALAFMAFQLPMSVVGNAIAQVFFQHASVAKYNGELGLLVEETFHTLILYGMTPAVFLAIRGRDLFVIFFGPSWVEAGTYIQIMSIWALVWFISSPLDYLNTILEKQEFGLKLNILIFITRYISLWIGGYLGNASLAILLFSVSGFVVYSYICFRMITSAGANIKIIKKDIYSTVYGVIPFGLLLIMLKLINESISLWVSVFLSCLLLFIYMVDIFRNHETNIS
jgi:O-antigen/teichoic acid export membrane protein